VLVHSVKFVNKKCWLRKKLPLGSQKKRGGADARFYVEKNNNVTLQAYY
jgi:hypothetical protein